MRLVWQWAALQRELPDSWTEARVVLTVAEKDIGRASALLGGANPLRRGNTLRLFVSRDAAFGPEAFRRALLRVDREDVGGTLELAGVTEAEAAPEQDRAGLGAQWNAAVSRLPADWSHLWAQVALRSTDQLERAALLIAPVNPVRPRGTVALRFRASRGAGYGVAAGMAHRCLERLDSEKIPGRLEILQVLCDTDPVATQGPVWRLGGRPV